jgi:DNA-directed RNA polymerase specialized sigma24 family protein
MLRIVARTADRNRIAAEELAWVIDERLESPRTADPTFRLTLEAAMKRLGPRQRSCVYLQLICGLTDRESAQVLDCKPSSVRSQTARALKALRATLADLEGTP